MTLSHTRYNDLTVSLAFICAFSLIVILFDLMALVFNIIQITAMNKNAASFTGAMLPIDYSCSYCACPVM